jgi:hypothetical protein
MATPLYYKGVRNNDKKQGQTYKEMNAKAQKMCEPRPFVGSGQKY